MWKITSIVTKELATGETIPTQGEKPVGEWIFTRGGHFAYTWVADGRKAAAGPVATDAERIELFNTMAFASGTYRVEGTTVSLQFSTSSNQSWTGTERKTQPQVSDKTFNWPSSPFKAGGGKFAGKDVMVVVAGERVE